MKVPSFMLKKLYVKGSLKNRGEGFEFALKNTLVDATITSPVALFVDNKPIPKEDIIITAAHASWSAADISESNPAPLSVDVEITVTVKGAALKQGEHSLEISATTKEYGDIRFTVKDTV